MTDARMSAADARAELIALGVAPWTDPNEEVAAVVAATLDCFLARPDLLAALVSVARPAAVTVEMVEAAYQAWWRERATYDDNLRLRAALEAAFAVTGHDDTTLRQDEVRVRRGTIETALSVHVATRLDSGKWTCRCGDIHASSDIGDVQMHIVWALTELWRAALDGTRDNENKGE